MFGTTNTGFPGATNFTNVSVTFSLQSTPDYADYPYRATFSNSSVTSNSFASVIYSGSQVSTGKYASFCSTFDGGVYLYATSNVGTVTIPTISIGMYSSGLNVDNTVTAGSQALITSGAVASAIAGKQNGLVTFSANDGSGVQFDKFAIQRGTKFKTGSGGDLQITFPKAFNDTYYTVNLSVYDKDGNNLWNYLARIGEKFTWGFKLRCQSTNNGNDWSSNVYVDWIAMGWLP